MISPQWMISGTCNYTAIVIACRQFTGINTGVRVTYQSNRVRFWAHGREEGVNDPYDPYIPLAMRKSKSNMNR